MSFPRASSLTTRASLLVVLLCLARASVVRDWCPTKEAFLDSDNALLALEGKTIRAGASIYPPFSILNETNGEWSGFDIEVFREAARRGRFKVEFIRLASPAENETWDDVLYAQGREMDIMCTWWGETYARKKRGIAFSYPILEQDLVLATRIPKRVERTFQEQFWVFLQPFSRGLWLTLLFGNLFTAIVVFVLDRHITLDAWTMAKPERRMKETYYPMSGGMLNWCKFAVANISNLFYWGWVLGTSQDLYKFPRNPWVKIYLMSWTGLLIVMTAAYTAQLTSFLLIDSRPVDSIDSFDDVTESGLPVCAVDNIPHVSSFFLNRAPSVPVVSIPTVDQAFSGIRNQKCAAALAGQSELELLVAENDKCDMRLVGGPLKAVSGAYPGDTSNCGSFVVHVIDGLVQTIAQEGLLVDLWSTYVTEPPQCALEKYQAASAGEQKNQLQIKALGGLFIIHAALASLAFFGFSMQKLLRKRVLRKNSSLFDDPQDGSDDEPWNKVAISSKSMKCSSKIQNMIEMSPLDDASAKGKVYPEGESEPVTPSNPKPSPFARGSSQAPLKSSMAKQPSDVLPPKLGMRTLVVTPGDLEMPGAQQALQARLDQRGSAMGTGSPRSGLASPRFTANNVLGSTDDLIKLQDSLSRANSFSNLAAGGSPKHGGSVGGSSQELILGSNSTLGSKEGENLHPSSMPDPAEQQSTSLGQAPSQDLSGNKPGKVASRSRLVNSTLSLQLAGSALPTEQQQQQQPDSPARVFTPRASAALRLDPEELPAASHLAEGGTGGPVGEAADHPAPPHVMKQHFAPEEDADAVKPFQLEESDQEIRAG